jgi:hypothetical protein
MSGAGLSNFRRGLGGRSGISQGLSGRLGHAERDDLAHDWRVSTFPEAKLLVFALHLACQQVKNLGLQSGKVIAEHLVHIVEAEAFLRFSSGKRYRFGGTFERHAYLAPLIVKGEYVLIALEKEGVVSAAARQLPVHVIDIVRGLYFFQSSKINGRGGGGHFHKK